MSDLDIHPDLFEAICRITANHIPSYENEWCLKFRNALFSESECASYGLGFDAEIIYTEIAEQNLFKYRCFKRTDILIQNMKAIENLSAWGYMGLDWIDNFDTQHLKQASKLMLNHFENPELFPRHENLIFDLLTLLDQNKRGYEIVSLSGQNVFFNSIKREFHFQRNIEKIQWYELDHIFTLPNVKSLVAREIPYILEVFECSEHSHNLTIKL